MAEPIQTVIVQVQQNFEIAGRLNPVQMKIEDKRVLDILKNKNAAYKLTPVGMLFPESIKTILNRFL